MQDLFAKKGKAGRKVEADSRFAAAAFLIRYRYRSQLLSPSG